MNDLYRNEWSQYQNFFIPTVKLVEKERIGSKYRKKYDSPKTPYQRILESPDIDTAVKEKLTATYKKLNPFELKLKIEEKLTEIFRHVKVTSNVRQRI